MGAYFPVPIRPMRAAPARLSAFKLHVNGTDITYGMFLNDLIGFLLVAAAVYFFMVAPMNAWKARAARNTAPADPASKKCPECLSEIPIAARRCAFCTSQIGAGTWAAGA
jgi:large conductance mechanosensitive channel